LNIDIFHLLCHALFVKHSSRYAYLIDQWYCWHDIFSVISVS
jgi:hypothetical protein